MLEVTESRIVEPRPHRFTVDDYYRMAEAGILGPRNRVQLIDGVVVDMPPIEPHHADAVEGAGEVFRRVFASLAVVRAQQPIHLGEGSESEPDITIAKCWTGVPRPYRSAHPTPKDVILVVEVSDATLTFDLGENAKMYAQHGIEDRWVLDIRGERVVVHRGPTARGYQSVIELRRGESITPLLFPEITLTVDDILG